MSLPTRTRICLECRTLCTTTCPAGHKRVVPLCERGGREELVDDVWGPPSRRPEALLAAAPVAKSNSSWSGWDIFGIFELDWFGLIVIVGALFWFAGAALVKLFRKRAALATAQGARRSHASLLRTGQVGTVSLTHVEPMFGQPAVAFATQLSSNGNVMLRDGATIGFDVVLDSGQRVRIPAGLCAIDMTEARALDDVDEYLAEVDPRRPFEPGVDPFHHDDARVVTIGPGDRVELLCGLDPCAADMAGYRDAIATTFVPRGFVRLRRA